MLIITDVYWFNVDVVLEEKEDLIKVLCLVHKTYSDQAKYFAVALSLS